MFIRASREMHSGELVLKVRPNGKSMHENSFVFYTFICLFSFCSFFWLHYCLLSHFCQVVLFIRQSRETRNKELNLVVRPNGEYKTLGGKAFLYKFVPYNSYSSNSFMCSNYNMVFYVYLLTFFVVFD